MSVGVLSFAGTPAIWTDRKIIDAASTSLYDAVSESYCPYHLPSLPNSLSMGLLPCCQLVHFQRQQEWETQSDASSGHWSRLSNPDDRASSGTDRRMSSCAGCTWTNVRNSRSCPPWWGEADVLALSRATHHGSCYCLPRLSSSRAGHLGRIAPDVTLRHILGDESDWVSIRSLFSFVQTMQFLTILHPMWSYSMMFLV